MHEKCTGLQKYPYTMLKRISIKQIYFLPMSVFKKDTIEKRVEKLEKQVKQILQTIGKVEKPEEVEEDDNDYCSVS